jgi:DNA-binding GntR family transcriptional regulator
MTGIPQLTATTLANQAYTTLRQAILDGALARGQKITERGLAEMLNISPTPVREAMRRLEQDRLIERQGPRTVTVAAFDDAEKKDIATIETTLRALAARLAATRATEMELQEMAAALDAADEERAALLARKKLTDRDLQAGVDRVWAHMQSFHEILDEASHSPMLLHMLRMAEAFNSGERREFLREELRTDRVAVDTRYQHHRAIFEALLATNEARAEELMLMHSSQSARPRLQSRQT